MKIVAIDKESPLYGRISPGADLVKINGHPVADQIDFHFYNTEDTLALEIIDGGRRRRLCLEDTLCGDLGLTFEETRIHVCNNNCLFCFVHQQPKGMRRSLYIKDDDYRFSFTHGNFVSLSGMSDADFERIIEQRLSPLYISVHATDDSLRRCLFQNEKLEPILPRLKQLTENRITLHTQTVICPGINDGDQLEKTISDLAALAPGVASLAVVPVGLTRHRAKLPRLRVYTAEESGAIIDLVASCQKDYLRSLGTRFVFPADEFFINAGRALPPLSYYEDMPQFENGVGMARQFITDFNRRRRFLPRNVDPELNLELVTGRSAEALMQENVMPALGKIENLQADLTVVDNAFWGETVTVTGLLVGRDIADALKGKDPDLIILPPNCLNTDDLFLDDMSLEQFVAEVGRPVITGSYNLAASIREAVAMWER